MFFKKNKKPQVESDWERRKRERLEEAKNIALKNSLSPAQVESVVNNNKDIDFLEHEFMEKMKYPDTEFLKTAFLPKNIDIGKAKRKDISCEDVMNAVILGDIIGSRFEFKEHDYEKAKTIPLISENSEPSDDTALTIATYKAIMKNKENPDFAAEYRKMWENFSDLGYGYSFSSWAQSSADCGYNSMGNGCAMRISPIICIYDNLEEIIDKTIKSVMTTHNHVESVKGSVVLAIIMWMALNNFSKMEISEYVNSVYKAEDAEFMYFGNTQFDINKKFEDISNDISKDSLFINYAVPFAVKTFLETDSYEACMREILSHFGDTDTICAIAGGLCECFYGKTGINKNGMLKRYDIIEEMKNI